jgi:molybdopterin molybdotransferase
VPAFDNSAVDGYAFAHADYERAGGRLPISARVAAGHASDAPLEPGTTARIFTGAVMPQGADTVAMQEDVQEEPSGSGTLAVIPMGLRQGANRRRAGEDLAEGALLLESGISLRPQELAAIASTGVSEIACHKRLKIAIVSTGDEILRPGAPFSPGCVYDANFYMLCGLLESVGAEITDLGVLEDRADTVRGALEEAARTHDAIITSGGASRGEEDHVVNAVDALGKLHMWQLAIKPGRPVSFGQIDKCLFFGLPGNPVAVMVCFLLYVRPVLVQRGGAPWPAPKRFPLPADFDMDKKPERREFLRGMVRLDDKGRPWAGKYPRDGSGLISSLRAADGLIEIPEEVTTIRTGDLVDFVPFSELGIV